MLRSQKDGVGNAKGYLVWAENSFAWKYLEEPSFIKNLKADLNSKIKIVEAGCGAGRTINFLLQNGVKESNVVGIDIDSQLLAYAQKRFPRAQYIQNSISEQLPINNNYYDLITCHNVLHYLNEKHFVRTLKNFYSWLKKDGTLFVMAPHPVHMTNIIYKNNSGYFKRRRYLVKVHWGGSAPHQHRIISDYLRALIKAGFIIEWVDEPEVISEGMVDPLQYKHYLSEPSRLVIKARK